LIIFSYKRLGCSRPWVGLRGKRGKTLFLSNKKYLRFEKFLRNLEKNKEKKRVSDTKGFKQQNHLDLKCS
jgi:hypothetical protein